MTKRFREAFPRRVPRAAPAQTATPWRLTQRNATAVMMIAQATQGDPNVILNEIIGCTLMSSQALHLQLAFGGILTTPQPQQADPPPPPEPEKPAEPDGVDERSAEEKLAELKGIAHGPSETIGPDPATSGTSEELDAAP